jgi:hypothetical protein
MKSFNMPTGSDKDINSLIEYVLDIKPYHAKLLQVTEESVFADRMKIRIIENLSFSEAEPPPPPD